MYDTIIIFITALIVSDNMNNKINESVIVLSKSLKLLPNIEKAII